MRGGGRGFFKRHLAWDGVVNPKLLLWARERAALSLEAVSRRLKIDAPVLRAWEAGEEAPKLSELRKLAALYRRPLAVFFLPEVPHNYTLVHDYRVPVATDRPAELTPLLARAIRAAQERREALLDWVEEEPEPFPVTASTDEDSDEVGARLRAALGITAEMQFTSRRAEAALDLWVSAIEGLRVLVFQEGRIEEGAMRGVSIPEQPLPIILLYGGDSRRGKVFTLLHELAHIALRQSALCTLVEGQATEAFCNRVAAAVLMPADLLLRQPLARAHAGSSRWEEGDLARLGRQFGVSDEAMLIRLIALGKAPRAQYEELRPIFQERYAAAKERQRRSKGGNYWATFMRDRGPRYVRTVLEAYYDERASVSAVAGSLGVRVEHLPKVERAAFSGV